jgi:NIPSNAP protein
VVYELRIYHVAPGKIENLVARFRNHTMKLFADHGIKSVAYWTALEERPNFALGQPAHP